MRADIDEHRRPWRRERPGLPYADVAAREPLPVEERTALFEALQALPTMQRKVVVLRHWLGLSVAETAHELRISAGHREEPRRARAGGASGRARERPGLTVPEHGRQFPEYPARRPPRP